MPTEILAQADKWGWLAVFCLFFVWLFMRERSRSDEFQKQLYELGKANVEAALRTAEALRDRERK